MFHDVATLERKFYVFLSVWRTFAVVRTLHVIHRGMCVLLRTWAPTLMFAFRANMVCIFPNTSHVQSKVLTSTYVTCEFHSTFQHTYGNICIPQHLLPFVYLMELTVMCTLHRTYSHLRITEHFRVLCICQGVSSATFFCQGVNSVTCFCQGSSSGTFFS